MANLAAASINVVRSRRYTCQVPPRRIQGESTSGNPYILGQGTKIGAS